jgi:hypothetical protein
MLIVTYETLMLSVFMLKIVMLSVTMLNIIMLNVVAPKKIIQLTLEHLKICLAVVAHWLVHLTER